MNALAPIAATRATPLGHTFRVWRKSPDAKHAHMLPAIGATLDEVVADAAPLCAHKDALLVLERDTLGGDQMLHAFVVRQRSRGRWVHRGHETVKVHELYAEPLFAVPVAAFEPAEAWRWTPGADVIGNRGVVEVRRG